MFVADCFFALKVWNAQKAGASAVLVADRVEYELWTNSNDECGVKCDMLMEFVKDFKGAAQILEKGGYTQFTPHYITWFHKQFTICLPLQVFTFSIISLFFPASAN